MLFKMFGFESRRAFFESAFGLSLFINFSKISAVLAVIATVVENNMGMPSGVIVSFIALNSIEWMTGVSAARYEGATFESKKLQRAVLKTFVYICMIYIMHQLASFEGHGPLWAMFDWTYWFSFSLISLTLIRSIFENLHRMKVKEVYLLYKILDNKYTGIISSIVAPPSKEKESRNKSI